MANTFMRMAQSIALGTLRNPTSEFIEYIGGGSKSSSGATVNSDTAMRVSTVASCVRVLSEALGQTPCLLYKRLQDKDRERAESHSIYRLLHNAPNLKMTASRWQRVMGLHLCYRGNAYSQIIRNPISGIPTALWPLHPDKVAVSQDKDTGEIKYKVTTVSGQQVDLLSSQVFHLRGLSQDGLVGMNPIESLMREQIGTAIAQQNYNAKLFANGANPNMIVRPKKNMTDQGAKNLKKHIKNQWTGDDNLRGIAIVFEDMDVDLISFKPEETQFLEQCKFSKEEIAAIFRVPLHLLNALDRATFNNIAELGAGFLRYTLQPYFTDWAQEIDLQLLSPVESKTYYCEFLTEAFERGTTKTRYETYDIGIKAGFLTPNEARRADNRPAHPDGDDLRPPATTPAAVSKDKKDEKDKNRGSVIPLREVN